MIKLSHISKEFVSGKRTVHAVQDVSLTIDKGEIFGMIGFSGAGKSTLVRCINLLERPTSGKVRVDGEDITDAKGKELADVRAGIGMIFQNFSLFQQRTVLRNVTFPLELNHTPKNKREERARYLLDLVGLADLADRYPSQLSGGQQQRVAAARAMVTSPAIVLADEPTGALDSNSSRMLLTMLTELNEQLAATILMVTHDAFSASYCHRILFIKDGQVFNELHRGTDTRKDFFAKILEVVSVLGGEQNDLI